MPVMKICPKCGGENAPGFVYCGKCGASLNGVPAVNLVVSQTEPPVSRPMPTRIVSNGVATIIKVIAVLVYLGGVIAGFALSYYSSPYGGSGLSVGLLLICLASSFFVGTMLLGFSEIIRLLNEINQKTR